MAKATMIFAMPEERVEFETAFRGADYKAALWSVDNYLRSRIKYEELDEPVKEALLLARRELHEVLEGRGITID